MNKLYSTNFEHFCNTQCAVIQTDKARHSTFYSLINGERFRVVKTPKRLDYRGIEKIKKEIHDQLMRP